MKSLLITGCSSGIGYDAAHTFHNRGWRVFATCRKEEDCARLREEGLESFQLDYADEQSVKEAVAEALNRTGGTLDALFNNGAYGCPGLVEDLPRQALREIFEVNVFGQFDLIRQVLPAMREQGHGRIVNNSSVLGFCALRFRGSYNATKFAMEGLTDTMRLELHGQNIHLMLIEPGPVTSDIRKNSIPHFEKWIDWKNSASRAVYEQIAMPRLYNEKRTKDRYELPASAVSAKLVHAFEAKRPAARYFVTTPTYLMNIFKRFLPTRAVDAIVRKI